ncbi:MAG: hypothetical protein E7022_08575 [Desulfovibrio desulfuricans]|jgi:hypothetical protein|uniref:hypothetical protein n=1 Tax=uncultured Desulfovibrio sp. TaxID=167968 RepID=UPI001B0B7596|nr:hypothetical protein [uncultured Desulfovibrio sp.]MBE6442356.1 hypothetical protein [Desulfovibrio desulfuricans]MBO5491575.1 hypothetical protein [Desulfovibrio sp.]
MLDYRLFKQIDDCFASGQTDKARRLLMEVQSRSIALRDEMNMLHIRLKTLEDALQLARNLCSRDGFYWLKTGDVTQGPFCPRCYEDEGGLIRLERTGSGLHCPYCHASFAGMARAAGAQGVRHARILPFA